jgi:hypothetical protein
VTSTTKALLGGVIAIAIAGGSVLVLTHRSAPRALELTSASASASASAPAAASASVVAAAAPGVGALCAKVQARRAWRLAGGTPLVPEPDEETIAIDLDKDHLSGFGIRVFDEAGTEIEHRYAFARLDADGKPTDRFADAYSEDKERLAIVAACAKTASKTIDLELRAGQESCRTTIAIGEGATWPATPEYSVLKWSVSAKRRAVALVRAKDLLPGEWPAPRLRSKDAASEAWVPMAARAIVPVDDDGSHVVSPPAAAREPVFAIEWDLTEWSGGALNGYACKTTDWCALPGDAYATNDEIDRALEKAAAISDRRGRTVYARRGPAGYDAWTAGAGKR